MTEKKLTQEEIQNEFTKALEKPMRDRPGRKEEAKRRKQAQKDLQN